jgi:crotonobetainyl-CoA:carnitine CoA-transferase CaiB-like acyl-CoA transferase
VSTAPLDGLRVVELAGVLAGPSAGQFLAELGADVVKVENARTRGDVTRRWTLPDEDPADGRPAYFCAANWGKRSAALDLTHADGRAALHALARRADVVLTAYKPGDAEALGADAPTLRALNPRLVVATLTGYGDEDPRAGYDAVVQAEAGFTLLNGEPDGPPTKMPVALMDVLAAHQLKEAILLALLRRERTGEGAEVAVSLLGAGASALVNQGTAWLQAGVVPRRMGSAHPQIAPYGTLYATADGAVVLAVGTDAQFAALGAVLDLALAADPRFSTNPARVRHRAALDEALAAATGSWTTAALLSALDAAHVPAGAVRDLPAVFAHPEAAALVLRDGAAAGLRQAAFRFEGSAPPPADLRPPPRYGEHTREVLAELGYADAEVARLLASGAAG